MSSDQSQNFGSDLFLKRNNININPDCYDDLDDTINQGVDFPPLYLSPIPQLDGLISPDLSITPPPQSPPPRSVAVPTAYSSHAPAHPLGARARQVGYALNRNKQLKKVMKDASANDFEIEINSNMENVNINCNTGFYSKVAIPTLQSLAMGGAKVINTVSVQCQDIVGNFDTTLAHQTTVIFFRLSHDKVSLGSGVRIHLHHTARKVQLQGGAIMPDKTTAPVWFMEEVLKNSFTKMANEKSVDISSFNQSVSTMVSNHLANNQTANMCGGCKVYFTGRSSPEQCKECGLSFHKKCFPSSKHVCHVKRRTKSCNSAHDKTPDPTMQHVAPPPHSDVDILTRLTIPAQQQVTAPGLSLQSQQCSSIGTTGPGTVDSTTYGIQTRTVTDLTIPSNSSQTLIVPRVPEDSGVVSVYPAHQPEDQPQPVYSSSLARSSHPTVTNVLDPNALPFVSYNTNSQVSGKGQTKVRGRGKKNIPPTDQASTELEFLKLEVSTLQADLQKQETELKDLRFRNSILMARNKTLEELKQQEIQEKYFPSPPQSMHQSANLQPAASSCSGSGCHHSHNCCIQTDIHHHCRPPHCWQKLPCQDQSMGLDCNNRLEVMNSKLNEFSQALTNQKQALDDLLQVLSPPTNETDPPNTVPVPSPASSNSSNPSVLPNTPTVHSDHANTSVISLDGFMFGEDCEDVNMNLN